MQTLKYSFVIPVYNRPNEIEELLRSFLNLKGNLEFEIVIVEDGSIDTSDKVIDAFKDDLNISYYYKENSGPGDSRNFGMNQAIGNYFIILDSDVILPAQYLIEVDNALRNNFCHCFGGPDAADDSFSNLQKAINFAMTSILTTGGIRGSSENLKNFQPRSFNMGLSKEAFEASQGFGKIHPGEDPDLALRLNNLGYETRLIKNAFVFHKRRISWRSFFRQVYKFGLARPILNRWHPDSKSILFWFPTLFSIGFLISILLWSLGLVWPLLVYAAYFAAAIISSSMKNKSLVIGLQSSIAICIQFFGYGWGYLKSNAMLLFSSKPVEQIFPKLFFK